jgi:CheY-like chemotaxis protein
VVRVLVVDDDPWLRAGRRAVLEAADGVIVVDVVDHATAVVRAGWDDVDVVLVDAHDPHAEFDHFAGVDVAARARAASSSIRIVVLSGHAFNDVLRLRMAEAGADEFHAHRDVDTADELVRIVTTPQAIGPGPAETTGAARARLGMAPTGSVNDGVRWAGEHLGAAAVDPSAAASGLSRRRTITARSKLAELMGLEATPSSAARRTTPSWRDITGFLDRARGRERRSAG